MPPSVTSTVVRKGSIGSAVHYRGLTQHVCFVHRLAVCSDALNETKPYDWLISLRFSLFSELFEFELKYQLAR